jgi:hypothetical protein
VRRRGLVAFGGCFALAGCGLALTGAGAARDDTGVSSDGGAVDAGGDTKPIGDTSAVDVEIDTGPPPGSCKDIKTRDPQAISGKKLIELPGRGSVEVYCDMQTLGGGFTLVARSTNGASSSSFGWTSKTGAIDVDNAAYSLDARGLAFTEVMIVEWKGFSPPSSGVIVDVPSDFLTAYTSSQIDVRSLPAATIEIMGSCDKDDFNSSSQMVRRVGYTNVNDVFYIRDVSTYERYGLRPNGFFLDGSGCSRSMDLDGRRGAIWVR